MRYAELAALSNFSFLRAASHPEELVARAAELGYEALAITDECSLAGAVRAHVAARERSLHLVLGSQITLSDLPDIRITLLIRNHVGYRALCRLITQARRSAPKGRYRVTLRDLATHRTMAAPDGWHLLVHVQEDIEDSSNSFCALLDVLQHDAVHLAITLQRTASDPARIRAAESLSRSTGWPIVACGDVRFHVRGRRALHDVLTAIRLRKTVHEAAAELLPNGEACLRTLDELAARHPGAWLERSAEIAARCSFTLDELEYPYPEDAVAPFANACSALAHAVGRGEETRWPDGTPPTVRAQIDRELALIHELGYEPYFLTVHDIVREARRRGILCQGRGSAANSAVCYALGITSVDPAHSAMLFERFLSKERNEPPDIDIDFEHDRREEIFQYVYARYGRERAALAASVTRYRRRSALRDSGRALGIPRARLDTLTANLAWWDEGIPRERLRESGIDPDGTLARQWQVLATTLVGFPRHLSQHTGGFVISAGRLDELVPIENAAMPDRTVIQWDKDDLDAAGLLKIDLLALGMLGAIRRAFEAIAHRGGRRWSLATIPTEDPVVYAALSRGDSVGVFQVESRAQMAMLPRLQPRCFYDLVVQIAIVRPGPIQGEMVHPYLRRRSGQEAVTYPSEAVRGVLQRTLGVPIFQEQIIQLAMVAAGFSAGEADGLRRAIGSWRKTGLLDSYRKRLHDGLRRHGYPERFAEQIHQQILGFGEYGFPESHAASFALLTYVSAWLKVHEPAAFLCALLNSQPMGFYSPWQLVQDAQRHGVEIRPTDVCHSDIESLLEGTAHANHPDALSPTHPPTPPSPSGSARSVPHGDDLETTATSPANPAVRLGLNRIRGLHPQHAEAIVRTRAAQPFAGLDDFVQRTRIGKTDLERLAAAGALAALIADRHDAQWRIQALEAPSGRPGLLPAPSIEGTHAASDAIPTIAPGERLTLDLQHTALSLDQHPLALLRPKLPPKPALTRVCETQTAPCPRRMVVLGLVASRQRPHSANGTVFLTLEDETGSLNVIVWRDRVEAHRSAILRGRLLEIHGRLQHADGVSHLIAERLIDRSAWIRALHHQPRRFG